MTNFAPERYEKGVWLSLMLSNAVVNLDLAEQDKKYDSQAIIRVRNMLQEHLRMTIQQGSLDYQLETPMRSALSLDVIPKIFGLSPKPHQRYTLEHYQEYLSLIMEQFDKLWDGDKTRTKFVREFLIDLSNARIARLEPPTRYIAA